MQFIDTNIIIRYLTKDDPAKAEACYRLFERAKNNQIALTTSEAMISEVVFILSSKKLYKLSPHEIRIRLYPVLSLPGLKLTHRKQVLRALDLFGSNRIDFEDALTVATMERQGITEIYSYDEDFDSIQGSAILRIEP